MGEYLAQRRTETNDRLTKLGAELGEAGKIAANRACVYVTGSFGRVEAGQNSDLDLFIVGRIADGRRALSRLDEICMKAELIETTRRLKIQEFSGDGEYLIHYTVEDLVKTLGHPNDDANNTFTARLLMLLESKALIESAVYDEAIDQVIAAYWGDFEDHKNEFVPGFLANDILRLWRTFCVNYEARTVREPIEKKAKRKLKNYKLKHSRLLTCYSAIAYLLAVFAQRKTVTPGDARKMTSLTPTERLEALVSEFKAEPAKVAKLLFAYEKFLQNTDAPEGDLVEKFMDAETSKRFFGEANEFGDQVWHLLEAIGQNTRLYRLLTV